MPKKEENKRKGGNQNKVQVRQLEQKSCLPLLQQSQFPRKRKKKALAPIGSIETKKPISKPAPATKLASNTTSKPTKTQPRPAPTTTTTTITDSGEKDSSNIKTLNEEISKLNVTVEGLEKERNFYFDKLREIEILCQTEDEQRNGADAQALKQEILKILYATDDNEEFQSPDPADQGKSTTNGTKSALTPPASTQSSSEKNLLEENVDELLADLQDGAREESGATF